MRKILIVIENYRIGGIQKSLLNMLNSIAGMFEIDVAAFDPIGEYKESIPSSVHFIDLPYHYRTFARPRGALKYSILGLYKILFFILTKLTNKGQAFSILSPIYKVSKQYDIAISYSHSGYYKSVNGICPEFVLKKTKAREKICFIHCDYENSGLKCEYNNKLYQLFDKIACCSNSVKEVFLQSNKTMDKNTFTVRNFFDLGLSHTNMERMNLSSQMIHVFTVARLSKEKGIDRAIEALHCSGRTDICYYIIGDGSLKSEIYRMVSNYELNDQVFLLGAISNPYPKLLNADYLLVPSYNEAAPIVFDEARLLGIRVIATDTTSTKEMLDTDDIICDNSIDGLCCAFQSIIKPYLRPLKKELFNNKLQLKQFQNLVE